MAEEDICGDVREHADALKMKFFGQSDMTFHEHMRRNRVILGLDGRSNVSASVSFLRALDDLIAKRVHSVRCG